MVKYMVTIEGHRVVALIDQFGLELSRLYIDGEFCDIYDPNALTRGRRVFGSYGTENRLKSRVRLRAHF
jgi:hypothetical protein